ncbi:hypothetical protein O3W52_33695 [Ensifer psoraleae]|uniref:Uncharacterized protein n=1 Tax=Sinorhizobium psoraleae TaxID=520838 RepID=A0ABT4KRP7_9HYPH|nr:hypothetical protein [Sinorhizobium psoraleae]
MYADSESCAGDVIPIIRARTVGPQCLSLQIVADRQRRVARALHEDIALPAKLALLPDQAAPDGRFEKARSFE